MTRPIYLDHHATTPVDPRVLEAMLPFLREEFGNAASRSHAYGWRAEAALEMAREDVASALGAADPREIVFTSGATESDNLALLGAARARRRGHVVISALEHPAVRDPVAALEREGFRVTVVPVGEEGVVAPDDVAAALEADTVLVSVMWANNEIGTVQPVAEIAARCRERGVPFHTDAAQAVGRLAVDVRAAGVDLLSLSGHKLYGPKGIGALYVRRGRPRVRIEPIVHGGGHEHGLRSGTVPVFLAVGLARALALAEDDRDVEVRRVAGLRDRLLRGLREGLDGVRVNGSLEARLPGNLHVSIDGVPADALLARTPELAFSTGSACSSARPEPSRVLAALGLPEERIREGFRLGLGRGTGADEVDRAVSVLVEAARALREERAAASRLPQGAANLAASPAPGVDPRAGS